MNTLSIFVFLSLNLFHFIKALPPLTNGGNASLIANGKLSEDQTCKTDDGRIEIPINAKFRPGTNPCTVCTCTSMGFLCDDQCETIAASTSTSTTTERSTTTTSTLPTPGFLVSSSSSTPPSPSTSTGTTPSNVATPTSSSSVAGNSDDDTQTVISGGSCSRVTGNGVTAARDYAFVDCSEVYLAGKRTSGIYEIWPRTSPKPFRVLCDMDTDGGGWTIIQRRGDFAQQSNFFASWLSYKRGFGDLSRDFWLGNERIFTLTNQDEYRLHIDMQDFSEQSRFVDYEWFFITSEQTKYTLNLGRYLSSSTAGDSLSYNRGMRFTTRDQDNDQSLTSQCAENYKSGWWHSGCTLANLNGLYLRGNDSTAAGVFWNNWLGAKYSLKACEMKVRPIGFNTEMLS